VLGLCAPVFSGPDSFCVRRSCWFSSIAQVPVLLRGQFSDSVFSPAAAVRHALRFSFQCRRSGIFQLQFYCDPYRQVSPESAQSWFSLAWVHRPRTCSVSGSSGRLQVLPEPSPRIRSAPRLLLCRSRTDKSSEILISDCVCDLLQDLVSVILLSYRIKKLEVF
jgi:hypothetical protein